MKRILAILVFPVLALGQAWSGILDPRHATDWRTGVGFTVPSYATPCSTQPTLQTDSDNALANTTPINNAIASCTSTQNVANIPAGT